MEASMEGVSKQFKDALFLVTKIDLLYVNTKFDESVIEKKFKFQWW